MCAAVGLGNSTAQAQLRIVTWNTNVGDFGDYAPRQTHFNNMLRYMGLEPVNGFAKNIDVLILQEQEQDYSSLQDFADELNAITGTTNYAVWDEVPQPNGLMTGYVYNTATVQAIHEDWRATGSTGRSTSRMAIRPIGYGSDADIWMYNTHYKADSDNASLIQRRDEARNIRRVSQQGFKAGVGFSGVSFGSDFLPAGSNIIYAGDFNMQSGTEEPSPDAFSYIANPYQIMQYGPNDINDYSDIYGGSPVPWAGSFTNGEAVDPTLTTYNGTALTTNLNWNNNSAHALYHTQSPSDGSIGGQATGGMDDRFDFQLVSRSLNDGEGVDYIGTTNPDPGNLATEQSYRTFGHNGSGYNQAASHSSNTGFDWIMTELGLSTTVRNTVRTSAAKHDHAPVVVDYQLPAVLDAMISAYTGEVEVGAMEDILVSVANAANVLAPVAADELDFTITISGDLLIGGNPLGMYAGTDYALGSGLDHLVSLDTSTPGLKSGVITVQASSQAAANPLMTFPINFEVIETGIPGDFDGDDDVDGEDFLIWQRGETTPPLDADLLAAWELNYGTEPPPLAATTTVPEPSGLLLLSAGLALIGTARRR